MTDQLSLNEPTRVFLCSDRALPQHSSVRPVDTLAAADALWVVERTTSVDSIELQQTALHHGVETVVCSMLRATVQEIGPCRIYIGSLASVAAASGIRVHCEKDLVRAARELRGLLRARSVGVISGSVLMTITGTGVSRRSIDGITIPDLIKTVESPQQVSSFVA